MKIPNNTFSVLIVDDEKKICRLIKSFLTLSVYFDKIVIAGSAVEAIQKLQNQSFDLLITDQMMPGKDGVSLIDHIYKTPKFAGMKIIMVSGYIKQEHILKVVNRGVKNIIVKPFSRLQILEAAYDALDLDKNPQSILYKNIVDVTSDEEDEDEDEIDFDGYE